MLQLDQFLNKYTGSLDTIGSETLTDSRDTDALLGALNAEIVMDLNGKAVAMFDIRASANSATYVFEGSLDGTNYYALPARGRGGLIGATVVNEALVASVTVATTAGAVYIVPASGWRRVRCRVSAYTSGNATVTARASQSDFAIIAEPQPSLLTANILMSAVGPTALIAAPGAGLFQYITSLNVTMQCTTATVTAVTPPTLTLSNLTAMVMNVRAIGAIGEVITCYSHDFSNPLKAVAAATVINATLSALPVNATYRIVAAYYLGP